MCVPCARTGTERERRKREIIESARLLFLVTSLYYRLLVCVISRYNDELVFCSHTDNELIGVPLISFFYTSQGKGIIPG